MDIGKQLEIIKRGVVELISEKELVDKLKNKKKLIIKLGLDPTSPDIHLGHTVVMNKLRQFQDFGHEVCLIIGDYTARIGDPSGRSATRPALTENEIKWNAATYTEQAFKVLDESKTKIMFNSQWLGVMSGIDIIKLAAKYNVARMLERDDFEKRYKSGESIRIHEFLYPLLQGQDSVELKADIEIGGTDQKFNLLVGRDLQREVGIDPQVILTMPLLVGTDGIKKMSKSYDNYIGISESPEEIFGKIMSISDEMMWNYYELLSWLSIEQIAEIKKHVADEKLHPKKAKEKLGLEIVARFYTNDDADRAKEHFDKVIVNKQQPDVVEEFVVDASDKTQFLLVDVIAQTKVVKSKSEIKRMIQQGGVSVNSNRITDIYASISTKDVYDIKIGKRKFVRIRFK
ncbi:MAG: tyrosine--tRNA ligase [Deltaproteobacteria bacterium CG07_land_8_20_14_0_80_38_7]|nr:MAG: tyrosine--tRNA ligase [Deltaproteobacteria bacterium CG07_land_8_20_14_0_80_38_7]